MSSQYIELEVMQFVNVAGRNIVATKVLSGEPSSETILKSKTNGTKWKIRGSAFLPAEKWDSGLGGFILEGESNDLTLSEGEKLIS